MGKNIKFFDEKIQQQIIDDYLNNKSMRQIEKDYGATRQSVAKFLEARNIKTIKGNHYRLYTHDYDYFEKIDTEEKLIG